MDTELEQPPQDLALAGRVRVRPVDEAEARRSAVVARDRVARYECPRGDDKEVVAAGVLDERCCGAGGAVAQRVVQRAHDNVIADARRSRERPREELRRVELTPPSSRAFSPRRISHQRNERLSALPPRIASLDERRASSFFVAVAAQSREPICCTIYGRVACARRVFARRPSIDGSVAAAAY